MPRLPKGEPRLPAHKQDSEASDTPADSASAPPARDGAAATPRLTRSRAMRHALEDDMQARPGVYRRLAQ